MLVFFFNDIRAFMNMTVGTGIDLLLAVFFNKYTVSVNVNLGAVLV